MLKKELSVEKSLCYPDLIFCFHIIATLENIVSEFILFFVISQTEIHDHVLFDIAKDKHRFCSYIQK